MENLLKPYIKIAKALPYNEGEPVINGPSILGISPGKKCFFTFPVRGERQMTFKIDGQLPDGIVLDQEKGILAGQTQEEGDFYFKITVSNHHGTAKRDFQLSIYPNQIALTPVMGWTSWNAYMDSVDQQKVILNANALVEKGLAARGYNYINIDSCWQGHRDSETLALQPNRRFPDICNMVSDIHSLGLKAGIYSTPMVVAWGSTKFELYRGSTGYPLDPNYPHTYFGGCGQFSFEEADARQWAEWGFDFLKYDWPVCDVEHTRRMSEALRKTDRDIILSLATGCILEEFDLYRKYANLCRSNVDTADRWESIRNNMLTAEKWAEQTGPGTWFDLDMLALGYMEIERNAENPYYDPFLTDSRQNRLTRDEQIFHMSAWALFPSSLILSCDLTMLDDFTTDLVCNEEILAINQDRLGRGIVCVHDETVRSDSGKVIREVRVYRKELWDNKVAYGFFNLSDSEQQLNFDFEKEVFLRDAWGCRDIGRTCSVAMCLPSHGAKVLLSA